MVNCFDSYIHNHGELKLLTIYIAMHACAQSTYYVKIFMTLHKDIYFTLT